MNAPPPPQPIVWPIDGSTGEILDLLWLDAGTRKPISPKEQQIIDEAAESDDAESILFRDSVPPYVRTEYHRQRQIALFGRHFLHQPARVLQRGDVRGIYYLEWIAHIDHMKRTGLLEEALELTYECIDAAERVDGFAHGWYVRAAIILRRLEDYETEVRLIERITARRPGQTRLLDRLPTARRLAGLH